MRIAGYVAESLIDGPGVRLVVFLQGCNLHCKGCQNPETHALDGGTVQTVEDVFSHLTPLTNGVTISGGEPTLQLEAMGEILREARRRGLSTMVYTGREINDWIKVAGRLLPLVDYVKAGPYVEELRDLSLPYCGSTNQHVFSRQDLEGERAAV
jgi:anaerobic ribonucleoside-triphosphate reductase activating protein